MDGFNGGVRILDCPRYIGKWMFNIIHHQELAPCQSIQGSALKNNKTTKVFDQ